MSVFQIPLRNNTFSRRKQSQSGADVEERTPKIAVNADTNEHEEIGIVNHDDNDDGEVDRGLEDEEESNDSDDDDDDDDQESTETRYMPSAAGKHRSLRYQHIEVLVTLIHKSMLDDDWPRAERAYGLLLRSKGIDVRLCHDIGLEILNHADPSGDRASEFLSRLIVAYPPLKPRQGKRDFDRAEVFVRSLVQLRMRQKKYRLAMQELETWLLVPPYKDDLSLWQCLVDICAALKKEEQDGRNDREEIKRLSKKKRKAMMKINGESSMELDSD